MKRILIKIPKWLKIKSNEYKSYNENINSIQCRISNGKSNTKILKNNDNELMLQIGNNLFKIKNTVLNQNIYLIKNNYVVDIFNEKFYICRD